MPATIAVTLAGCLMAEMGRGVALADAECVAEVEADVDEDDVDEVAVDEEEAEVEAPEGVDDAALVAVVDEAAPVVDPVGRMVGAATGAELEVEATEAMAVMVLLIPSTVLGGFPTTAAIANCPADGKVTITFPN